MATTKALELGQFGSKVNVHNEDITLDGNVHGQYAGFDSDFTGSIASINTGSLSEGTNLYYTDARADARAQLKIDALVGSAPGTLDTLQELGDALGDDPNFATTVTNSIATKLPLAGGTLTGNLSLTSTASGSSASPELELRRDITGADANYLGQIKFTADNDADQNIVFAKITGKILDASDGTEDGIIEFAHKKAGSNNISARFRSDSLQLINGTNLTVDGTTELTGTLGIGVAPSSAIGVYSTKSLANGLAAELTNTESSTGSGLVVKGGNNSSTYSADFRNYNNTTLMRIRGDGNVGIGTTSPDRKLDVRGSVRFSVNTTTHETFVFTTQAANDAKLIMKNASSQDDIILRANGDSYFNGGNVGIGTSSPSRQLDIYDDGTVGQAVLALTAQNTDYSRIMFADPDDSNIGILDYAHSDNSMRFTVNNAERMRIDSLGNVGIGVTPHAGWYGNATALQIATTGALYNTSNFEDLNLANNVYINSSGTDSYIQNDAACKIRLTDAGLMDFRVAGAGTAGNAISWDTAFAITATGRVGVGITPTDQVKFEVDSGTNEDQVVRIRFKDDNNSNATANPFSYEYKNLEIENNYSGAAPSANGTKVAKLQLTTVTAGGYAASSSIMGVAESNGHEAGAMVFATGPNSSGLEVERMRIGRTGNVGIGTSSPTELLSVGNTSTQYTRMQFYAATNGASTIHFGDGTSGADNYRGYLNYAHDSNSMQFATNGTERMRIDSSGNLLVGHTSADVDTLVDNNTVGITLKANGEILASSTATVATLERENSDGDLIEFRKDGTTVGSIGNPFSNAMYITGPTSTGSGFVLQHDDKIYPAKAGARVDGYVDLGGSVFRYKDAYLSGGVYLGGTGSANKLDDYEEGSYIAGFATQNGSIALLGTHNTMNYTKIGRQVTITGRVVVNTVSGASGWVRFSLPFTNVGESEDEGHTILNVTTYKVNGIGTGQVFAEIGPSTSYGILLKTVDNVGWQYLDASGFGANDIIYMNGTYLTNS